VKDDGVVEGISCLSERQINGGENLVVESDETYVGGKAANAHRKLADPEEARCCHARSA
jgi:hypothetical protein